MVLNDTNATENSRPTPYYRYARPENNSPVSVAIYWNVEQIACKPKANGWIMQHVKRLENGLLCSDYYEIWRVVDGFIVYEDPSKKDVPDDHLYVSPFVFNERRDNSIELDFVCIVFWVERADPFLSTDLANWKPRVSEAGDLPSIKAADWKIDSSTKEHLTSLQRFRRIVHKCVTTSKVITPY